MTAPPTRSYAPSAARNRDPILEVLRRHLPRRGLVLEIASGTGEHAVHFAQNLGPELVFQPSDPNADARASIAAWHMDVSLANLRAPIELDVCAPEWWTATNLGTGAPVEHPAAIVCINMIHIAPWEAAIGLITGAGQLLAPSGLLILYGPYKRGGLHTAPSNEAFDADLRASNSAWGVRDLETVASFAASHGFDGPIIEPMPANNLTLIFRRL